MLGTDTGIKLHVTSDYESVLSNEVAETLSILRVILYEEKNPLPLHRV